MSYKDSGYEKKENSLYETEPWATGALLRHIKVAGKKVWEPAAGNHLMADVILEAGAALVFTSDIQVYDRPHGMIFDFLGTDQSYPHDADMIITNPPYGKSNRDAVTFAEKALMRCKGWVCLLLTMKFDSGKTRVHLFRDNPRFAGKIVLLDRIQWFPGETTGTEDHCWVVFRPIGRKTGRPIIVYEGRDG